MGPLPYPAINAATERGGQAQQAGVLVRTLYLFAKNRIELDVSKKRTESGGESSPGTSSRRNARTLVFMAEWKACLDVESIADMECLPLMKH
jgi:hypothetical protein